MIFFNLKYWAVFSIILLVTSSCSNRKNIDRLDKAQELMFESADSAYLLLKEIEDPEKLPADQQAKYGVLFSTYQMMRGFPLKSDSLIAQSVHYYQSMQDTVNLLKASFLAGRINYVLENNETALKYLSQSNRLALQLDSVNYLSWIWRWTGFAYRSMKNSEKALDSYQKALDYSIKINDKEEWVYYWDMAAEYQSNKKNDLAIQYYEKALATLDQSSSDRPRSFIYNQLSQIYADKAEYKTALYYVNLSQEFRTSRVEAPVYNLAKGRIFLRIQQMDSARLYLKRAIESPDLYVATSAQNSLSELNDAMGNYKEAYSNKLNYKEGVENASGKIDQAIWQQQFQDEKVKNENNMLKLAKRKREIYLLGSGIILLLVFILLFVYYTNEKKKKAEMRYKHEEQELKNKTLLLENQNLILTQERELIALMEKASSLRASIFRKMSISEKIPSLDHNDHLKDENGSDKRIRLSETEWEELIRTVDESYPGFVNRMLEIYPEMNKNDVAFCCLVKINVSMQDLSDIYCISKAGITKKKTRMKKEKLGIMDENLTLDDFLQSL